MKEDVRTPTPTPAPTMDFPADAGGGLSTSKRFLFAGVLGLAAVKVVSACFHNYQLYEVDRLVNHISRTAEAEKKRRERQYSVTPSSTVSVAPAVQDAAKIGTVADAVLSESDPLRPSATPTMTAHAAGQHGIADSKGEGGGAAPKACQGDPYAMEEAGESSVDMSTCSHGISSIAHDRVMHECTALGAAPSSPPQQEEQPSPPVVIGTARDTTRRDSVVSLWGSTSTSPQAAMRNSNNNCSNSSGIFITAVHLVGGEPAPSTSQLLSRLSRAGGRSLSSPSPSSATALHRHRANSVTSPASAASTSNSVASSAWEVGNSFSVVHVDPAAASASRLAVSVTHSDAHDVPRDQSVSDGEGKGVVHEVEVKDSADDAPVGFTTLPQPIHIYEGAAPVNAEGEPVMIAVTATAAADERDSPQQGEPTFPASAPTFPAEARMGDAVEEGDDHAAVESPLPYFSFTTTSVHIAKVDMEDGVAEASHHNRSNSGGSGVAAGVAAAASQASTSNYVSSTAELPRASVYLPLLSVAGINDATGEAGGRSFSPASANSSTAPLLSATAPRPMVHLFIQPRWALAPSLSPACTKWETFLRLHHISYTVHEVHVLRSDQPQAQSTDVPQQIQQLMDRRGGKEEDEDSATVTEARAFASVLTETTTAHKLWQRVEARLRRVLPPGALPGGFGAQYSLPFIMVGGTVLKGAFNDVVAELAKYGLVRPFTTTTPPAESAEGTGEAPSSPYTPEEQRAIGQAVERTAEYTLRLLYEVGLLLEGSAVFSHYAAQLWSGHRYWDVFQVRRWLVYAWLAVPFLSALKADVGRGLQGHELGGLTREQLYRSLQSDLVSLEQLLVASAETVSHPSQPTHKGPGEVEVRFLLGREPGPQDCALYAYLLPILRLSPRDIAHIHNPNFTYIYESRVFRGFVSRMSREAFPDLDVLLQLPRKPSFVMALLNVTWSYAEARAPPGLAALRMRMDQWLAKLYSWLGPCRAALWRCVQRILTSGPARQIRLLQQRFLRGFQRLVFSRRVPSSTNTTVPQSRRQCKQTWWHFLDASRTPDQPAQTSVVTGVSDEKAVSLVVQRDSAEHGSVPTSTADEQPVATAVLPRPTTHVNSGTQVMESLDEFAVPPVAPAYDAVVDPAKEEEPANAMDKAGEVVVVLSPLTGSTASALDDDRAVVAAEAEEAALVDRGVPEGDAQHVDRETEEVLLPAKGGAVLNEEAESDCTPPVPVGVPTASAAELSEEDDEEKEDHHSSNAPTSSPDVPPTFVPPLNLKEAMRNGETRAAEGSQSKKEEEQPMTEQVALPGAHPPSPPPALTQQQQEQQPTDVAVGPVSPRIVHDVLAVFPVRRETSAGNETDETCGDSPAPSTRRENNTVTNPTPATSTSSSFSPVVTRRDYDKVEQSATTKSAPSPRPTGVTGSAASAGEAGERRFTISRAVAAGTIARSLGCAVEPGYTAEAAAATSAAADTRDDDSEDDERLCRGSRARLSTSSAMAAAARPTTTTKKAERVSAGPLRAGRKVVAAASTATTTTGADDDSDLVSKSLLSNAPADSVSTTSERRPSITPSSPAARSTTTTITRAGAATTTPTRQRRPSGLSPGLFTTVVNRNVYLTDGREHPSWKVDPRRRTASVTADSHTGRTSPAPSLSRRGSTAGLGGADGTRSPATDALSRTVTPIRKLRPSPAGRPTA